MECAAWQLVVQASGALFTLRWFPQFCARPPALWWWWWYDSDDNDDDDDDDVPITHRWFPQFCAHGPSQPFQLFRLVARGSWVLKWFPGCVIVAWQNYDPLSLLWSNTFYNRTNMFMSTWTIPLLLTLCFVAWQNYDRHPLLTRVTWLPDSWTHSFWTTLNVLSSVNTLSLNVVNWSWNTYSSFSEKWQGISIITWMRDMKWMKVHPPYLQRFLVKQTFFSQNDGFRTLKQPSQCLWITHTCFSSFLVLDSQLIRLPGSQISRCRGPIGFEVLEPRQHIHSSRYSHLIFVIFSSTCKIFASFFLHQKFTFSPLKRTILKFLIETEFVSTGGVSGMPRHYIGWRWRRHSW